MSTSIRVTGPGRFRHIVFSSGSGGLRRSVSAARLNPELEGRVGRWACESAPGLSDEAQHFLRLLFSQARLDGSIYREETLCRRVPACLRILRAESIAHARQMVTQAPELAHAGLSALVIGVTAFFRDACVFDHLTFNVLPALMNGARAARIWSAGCSDGAELYSVAILLQELNLLQGSYLMGTDVRSDALARARDGYFDDNSLREVPPAWLGKYFDASQPRRRICERLRSALNWRSGNMIHAPEPGPWDMILCRNVSMYMKPSIAADLWAKLELLIRPGGFLVLGKAERPVGARRLSPIAPCIYRRDRG